MGTDDRPATESHPQPPGPTGLPIVGNLHRYVRDPLSFVERCAREYGDVVYTDVASMESYMITHPSTIERVLVSENDRFRNAELAQGRLEPLLGTGLVVSDGDRWRRQRTRLQPAFRPDRIATYAELMRAEAVRTVDAWSPGETIRLEEAFGALSLRILVRSLFGTDLDGRGAEIREAFELAMGRFDGASVWVPEWVPTPTNRRFREGRRRIDAIVADLIDERRADAADRIDLLSALLVSEDDRGETMEDRAVRDELVTLLVAGHDTTALALTYATFLLVSRPDAAERVGAEVESVLADDTPTTAALASLPYTGAAVSEALRLYPPTPATAREPIEDVVLGGYRVPAGSTVLASQWVVHRDERWWDDPAEYRPERWLADADRPEYAYFPFGGGPRHCLGHRFALVEARIVLATILERWRLEPVGDEPSVTATVSLRPTEPVDVVVRERR